MSSSYLYGCEWCGGSHNGGNCPGCSMVESGNGFVYDQNPYSYHETTDFFHQPPQHEMETYSCESYGGGPHQGFDCQTGNTLVYEQVPCNNQNFGYDQHPYDLPSQSQQFYCCELCGGPHYSSDCQTRNPLVYEHTPYDNHDSSGFDQPSQYTTPQPLPQSELTRAELITKMIIAQNQVNMNFQTEIDCLKELILKKQNPPLNSFYHEESDEDDTETTMDEVHNSSPQSTAHVPSPPLAYTPSLPRLDVSGDQNLDIDLPFGEHLDTLSMGDREIDFNPSDIESLPANDPVPIPRMSDEPLGNSDSISRSFDVTISNPLFDFDDSFTLRFDNKFFDDEFEDLSSLDHSKSTPLIDESTILVTPLPDSKQICLREVERFDPFFSLTQSGDMTWVMDKPFRFTHTPLPRQVAYSPKEVLYRFYHPNLTLSDGCDHDLRSK